jgi:hypothetical protein
MTQVVVDNVGHEAHDVLHPKTKLLEVLPLFRLIPIIHHDIGLVRRSGGSKADPPWTPVLHLLLRTCLDASDELLHCLERTPVMQELIDKGGESSVVIN